MQNRNINTSFKSTNINTSCKITNTSCQKIKNNNKISLWSEQLNLPRWPDCNLPSDFPFRSSLSSHSASTDARASFWEVWVFNLFFLVFTTCDLLWTHRMCKFVQNFSSFEKPSFCLLSSYPGLYQESSCPDENHIVSSVVRVLLKRSPLLYLHKLWKLIEEVVT